MLPVILSKNATRSIMNHKRFLMLPRMLLSTNSQMVMGGKYILQVIKKFNNNYNCLIHYIRNTILHIFQNNV